MIPIVDLDKNQPIAILQSRRSEELRKLFEEWGSVILFQIEEVSIDLIKLAL
jgi:transposase